MNGRTNVVLEGKKYLAPFLFLHGFRSALGKYVCNKKMLHIYYK